MNPYYVSLVTNILLVVIGGLLARWIAGEVKNLRNEIRIAVLELEKVLAREYVTKGDLEKVRAEIKLGDRVDAGFGEVLEILRDRRLPRRPTTEVVPT